MFPSRHTGIRPSAGDIYSLNNGYQSLLNRAGFWLPLNDSGSGAVNTTLARGTGSATFTRATTATTVDSTGLIVSVASGVARSYYDPSTLEYRGYIAEGARTNVCLQSNGFGTTWTDNVGTPTQAQDAPGPDGQASSAWTVTDNDAASIERKIQNITIADDSTTWTITLFVAKTTSAASFPGFSLGFAGGASPLTYDYLVNTDAGSVTARSTNSAGTITTSVDSFPLFWRARLSGANNSTGNTTLRLGYMPAVATTDTSTFSAAAVGTAVIYGFMAENAAFPSTYIPTTTAAVTRNADVLTYTFAGNADATVGTAYAEIQQFGNSLGSVINFTASGANATLGSTSLTTSFINDGTTNCTKTGLADVSTAIRKHATTWGGAGLSATGDGATPQTAAFDGSMPSTSIAIGCGTGGLANLFGTLKNIRIWQTQFSAAQLQLITR